MEVLLASPVTGIPNAVQRLQNFTLVDRLFTAFRLHSVFLSVYAKVRMFRATLGVTMKSLRFRFLLAALAVLLGSALMHAQTADDTTQPPTHPHMFRARGEMMGFFSKKLNLTDEQKAQMKSIMQKEHPAMKPLFQQQHQIDQQLHQYAEGNFDAAKVQALATQKAQVQAQLTVAETRIHNELYQVLTPDQQTQLKQMEANREARMQQHMQEQQQPQAAPEQQ
jgi:Spy/CpxP family protein refolding chaperone